MLTNIKDATFLVAKLVGEFSKGFLLFCFVQSAAMVESLWCYYVAFQFLYPFEQGSES